MQRLLAAGAALALLVSAGQACDFHQQHVTASATPAVEPVVAMSTYDPAPVGVAEETPQAALPGCPADAKDCVPATK